MTNVQRCGVVLPAMLLALLAGIASWANDAAVSESYLGRGWRFAEGKVDPAWSSEAFDDSEWKHADPANPEDWVAGTLPCPQTAYYRQRIHIPLEWENTAYWLQLGAPRGAEIFLNGELLASLPPHPQLQNVPLPSRLAPGTSAMLAIQLPPGSNRLFYYANRLTAALRPGGFDLSSPLPVAGRVHRIHRNARWEGRYATELQIASSDGTRLDFDWDETGTVSWTPPRHGRFRLVSGEVEEELWVTKTPLRLHLWSSGVFSRYATSVLRMFQPEREALFRERGTRIVQYAGGTYMAQPEVAGERYYRSAADWLQEWKRTAMDADGLAVDEMNWSSDTPNRLVAEAVAAFAPLLPEEYEIAVYITDCNETDLPLPAVFRRIARDGFVLLQEIYCYNFESWYRRYRALKLHGLAEQSLICLSPAADMVPGQRSENGMYTVEELHRQMALCRRIAPWMPGIAFFNAYQRDDIDAGFDGAFEAYFLRAILYFEPGEGGIRVWNIGQEDTREAIAVEVKDSAGNVLAVFSVPALEAQSGSAVFPMPPGAVGLYPILPEGMASLYGEEGFRIPEDCKLPRVSGVSELTGTEWEVRLEFSEPMAAESFSASSVQLRGAWHQGVVPLQMEYDADTQSLRLSGNPPPDDYTLFLYSASPGAPGGVRSAAGAFLDGDGNGFHGWEAGQNFTGDHYTLHFSISK